MSQRLDVDGCKRLVAAGIKYAIRDLTPSKLRSKDPGERKRAKGKRREAIKWFYSGQAIGWFAVLGFERDWAVRQLERRGLLPSGRREGE